MAQAPTRPLDDDAFETVIEAALRGQAVDAANLTVSASAVARLVAAARASDGRPVLHGASFQRIAFEGSVDFRGVTFEGDASFGGCIFDGDAAFDGVRFRGGAGFQDTTRRGHGYFIEATFEGDVRFEGPTVFHQDARFDLESSVSLLRAPSRELTAGGEAVTIGLRLLGPLLFGLALLALHGRVKR